jgi:hypothetical protein
VNLTIEQIQKFKKIYKKVFDEDISDERAYEEGLKILDLVKFLHDKDGEYK